MYNQNVPPVISAIVQFCHENSISTDEEFFKLFDSINWHDADCESAEQFIRQFTLAFANVNQDGQNAEK
ncbi:hypothetical protein [Vibrio sp. Hal054]|uniref:hypothetical protein n=1 Tax=Vibrio sp. Hal054 TaxID=3035158 RepID=UPI00301D2525